MKIIVNALLIILLSVKGFAQLDTLVISGEMRAIPKPEDQFKKDDIALKIKNMDGNRIDVIEMRFTEDE
jgi:CBS domain containing-hemolysin-like protein